MDINAILNPMPASGLPTPPISPERDHAFEFQATAYAMHPPTEHSMVASINEDDTEYDIWSVISETMSEGDLADSDCERSGPGSKVLTTPVVIATSGDSLRP